MNQYEAVEDSFLLFCGTKILFAFNLILREQSGGYRRLVKTGGQTTTQSEFG